MLTRNDQTVTDCLDVFEIIKNTGLKHVGFKDIGVSKDTLKKLNKNIKNAGMTSYLEVVSTSNEACLESAKAAKEVGIDRLMGGTNASEILKIIKNEKIEYYPFPGRPEGHPTKLGGTPEEVEKHCKDFISMGCAGVDLLAYRATESDPIELAKAAKKGLGDSGLLICAGSVDTPEKIKKLCDAGTDLFTIGSAAFDGSFSPTKGSLNHQIEDILKAT